MPRLTRAILMIVPLALLMVLAASACEEASPPASSPAQGSVAGARISVVDSDTVDFGQVPLDTMVRHTFNIQNVGSETLTLRNVSVKVVEGC